MAYAILASHVAPADDLASSLALWTDQSEEAVR